MPEKEKEKIQEKSRHAWPPEAITCYMPTYFVLKEQEAGRDTYTLVRAASGKSDFVIRTRKYTDLLETVIQDATIPMFSVTPRQLIEGSFGEPRWKYGSGDDEHKYEFAKRPDYFLKPDFEGRKDYEPKSEEPKAEEESKSAEAAPPDARICPKHKVLKARNGCRQCRSEGTAGTTFDPVCPQHGTKHKSGIKHGRQSYKCPRCARAVPAAVTDDGKPPMCEKHGVLKVKDGHKRAGVRRWRCLTCNPRGARSKKPRGVRGGLTAYYESKVKDNPPCETCGERARVARRVVRAEDGATVTYWHCTVTGCERVHKPTVQALSGEELEHRLTAAVTSANGHDPQNRKDVVNELVRRILAKEITLAQAMGRKTIREVVKEVNSLYQGKYGKDSPLPLDAPAPSMNGERSKQTYADRLESSGMNPEEVLMAKETEEDTGS